MNFWVRPSSASEATRLRMLFSVVRRAGMRLVSEAAMARRIASLTAGNRFDPARRLLRLPF